MMKSHKFIGQPIARIEDHALITGTGRFVGDIYLPGTGNGISSELVRARTDQVNRHNGGAGNAWRTCGPDLLRFEAAADAGPFAVEVGFEPCRRT